MDSQQPWCGLEDSIERFAQRAHSMGDEDPQRRKDALRVRCM